MSEYDPNYIEVKHYYRVGVKTVLLNSKREVLILKRSDKTPHAGDWDLPGGSIDESESPETAAIRETIEETGIEITDVKVISSGFIDGRSDPWIILGFRAEVDDPEVILSWEHDEYRWVPIDAIESSELPDGYKQLVRAAISY